MKDDRHDGGYPGGGGHGGGGGGYPGSGGHGGDGYCRYGCCRKRYNGSCMKCCGSLNEVPEEVKN
jgi:hypothetical protein